MRQASSQNSTGHGTNKFRKHTMLNGATDASLSMPPNVHREWDAHLPGSIFWSLKNCGWSNLNAARAARREPTRVVSRSARAQLVLGSSNRSHGSVCSSRSESRAARAARAVLGPASSRSSSGSFEQLACSSEPTQLSYSSRVMCRYVTRLTYFICGLSLTRLARAGLLELSRNVAARVALLECRSSRGDHEHWLPCSSVARPWGD
ncbi:hypothetical protein FB45DRAFT_934973 [Roridomyces roridus]|uniref:Uncharacterized protein n=1 Tax=Roridomyces roridus TaxID=1738132 RepID=A0AAD7BBF4_9AGAR|nr:hypothetical protein FB45DRAFT_934973 [Roridomyces roridus]